MLLPYIMFDYFSKNVIEPSGRAATTAAPITHWLSAMPTYIRGSMPRTGWPFSVSQFISSSQSVVMVSSAT